MSESLPQLTLKDWQATRDSLHFYTLVLGKLRRQHMPKLKHWWHITLDVSARGYTTTPVPFAGQTIEFKLDLIAHAIVIESSNGWQIYYSLLNQTRAGLCQQIIDGLAAFDITIDPGLFETFQGTETLVYDTEAIARYHRANSWIDAILKTFKGSLREESGPVHLFPHHLDLCMNWFSGRLVPGADPADEEAADEQMTFGFVTGDSLVEEAYFFITAYPCPEKITQITLPKSAYWLNGDWTGAIMPYAALLKTDNPEALLLEFFSSTQTSCAKLMC